MWQTGIKGEQMKTTIFSIDPNTNQPYMTVERALKLAETHINKTCQNLLNHHHFTVEDLVQEIMLKVSSSAYNPAKSAAQTFFIMCASSCMGSMVKINFKSGDRYKCGADFVVFDSDGEATMATEHLGVETVTPYDYLAAEETVSEHYKTSNKHKPDGWRGFYEKKLK